MSLPATFDDVFVRACAAKVQVPASDLMIVPSSLAGAPLVSCGGAVSPITFSCGGLKFTDESGKPVAYSWQELDFILPGDLSLASDKLNSFTDFDLIAENAARKTVKVCAIGAVIFLAYLVISFIWTFVAGFVGGFDYYLGTFGDIVAIALLIMLAGALAPAWLPIVVGLAASGGIFAALGNAIGKATRPAIRWILAWRMGPFPNGLVVINSRWIKLPWGTPTSQLVDFIMIGVKLRRRGLA